MVIPVWMAGASLGLQGIGTVAGLLGQRSANKAAQAQLDLAYKQLYLQQRLARLQEEMARAGSVDARGNVVEYVPGVGWVERPSERTQRLMDASDTEELLRLTQDAVQDRLRREAAFPRRMQEESAADARLREFTSTSGRSRDAIEAALLEAGMAEVDDPIRDMRANVALQALREGSNAGNILARLAREGARGRRSAIARARLEADGMYSAERGGRDQTLLAPYDLLSGKADTPTGMSSFSPNNIADGMGARALNAGKNASSSLYGAAISLSGGPKINDAFTQYRATQPNYGAAGTSLLDSIARFMEKNPFNWGSTGTSSFTPDISETLYGGQYARHF